MAFSRMLKLISKNTRTFITLRQEIGFITDYISIKKYNNFQNLTLQVHIPESMMELPVLKLLLQPFVENCLKHGFDRFEQDGIIFIYAYSEQQQVHIIIEDNGSGMKKEQIEGILNSAGQDEEECTGIGIRTCMERLKLQYGSRSAFSIESDEHTFTRISISYPVKEATHDADPAC